MSDLPSGFIVAVVDDDQGVLRALQCLLESADHEVRVFRSGAEFLDSGCLPLVDGLISDIDMPGIDGFELLRRVESMRPGLPMILITGYPETLNRLAPFEGRHRIFTKPFEGPALLAAMGDEIRRLRK